MSEGIRPGPRSARSPELVRHNMRIPKDLRAVIEDIADAHQEPLAAATRRVLEAGVESLLPGALKNLHGKPDGVP